ncbi:ATP-binding protein [uncultured Algimonas sp.]|uniref:hybrid sensor histidine kinase/response regulator n=1 Tax=uncultured Algimonas sp. TaxID=1547920 RepID=UPI002638691F|nr:ATP-binding protein [uncultured Algimonas sp.]
MDDSREYEQVDRRTSIRRKEDYFWLKRLADLTGEACLAVNRRMDIEYIDDKVFDVLRMDPPASGTITKLGQLTGVMAERGYFGKGDPKVFEALISDLLVNQRLKQAKATQIINAVTPSGQHIDIRVSLGRDDGYLILMRDTTEQELQHRVLEAALEIGESGYWYYNIKTRDFYVRADSLRQHFSPENHARIFKEGFTHAVHPDDVALVRSTMSETIKSCRPAHGIIRVIGDDGNVRHLKSSIMPNVDESGKARSLCCFFTDITKQIMTEAALRQAQQEAENLLGLNNDFLGRMSHEVRTPLNAVIGIADALVNNSRDPELTPQLKLIQSSAEQVMVMVDDTLEHAKLSEDAVELDIRDLSPGDLVRSICSKWRPRAEANQVKLTCTVHEDVPATAALDGYRLEQCLGNLLSNAIKFTAGGKVQVLLAPTGQGEKRHLILAVRDTGIGMTEQSISQIFLPFKQADKSISSRFGGTGLGLSIVKDLVDLMGGRINVTSEHGKGTVFAISLPLAMAEARTGPRPVPKAAAEAEPRELRAEPSASPQNAEPVTVRSSPPETTVEQAHPPAPAGTPDAPSDPDKPYGDVRVLIVDDNATNHIVASSLLARVVGEIETALNGQEAIDMLKKKRFDLVLMDIHMPVMDGIETTLAIRSEPSDYQNVPIIALTADPQYQQARLCRNIGMNASLGKPIKLAGLMQAFEDVLSEDGKSVASAA